MEKNEKKEPLWEHIRMLLNKEEYETQNAIAKFAAEICDVNLEDMYVVTCKTDIAQARWFMYYAIRYTTQETYERMAERLVFDGVRQSKDTIRKGVERMSFMVNNNATWKKRWALMKRVLQEIDSANGNEDKVEVSKNSEISITIPRELKNIVKVQIKEK